MGRCKDCKNWDKRESICGHIEWVEVQEMPQDDNFVLVANSDDDQGLEAYVRTGPDFGCTKFKAEE